MNRTFLALSLALTLLAPLAPGARKPGSALRPALLNAFSRQQDVQMGQEAATQVRQQQAIVKNAFLQAYISKVGLRIAETKEAKASGFPFSFELVADPTINAFALPGGPMFIQTGLISAVDNEAQLAGVMGHELAHVILRHGTHQASKATGLQMLAGMAGAVAGQGSIMGQLAQAGIGLGANSVLLKFSRDAETDADALGSHLMAESGYDPKEMANFFAKLGADGGARGPQFFNSHPNPENREAAIDAEVKTLPVRTYGYQSGEFIKAKAEIAKLPKVAPKPALGTAPAAPVTPDTTVSATLKTGTGQGFAIQYPDNWQAVGENTAAVTIAPKNGVLSGGAVGLGVILNFTPNAPGKTANLALDTEALLTQLKADNPNMKVVSNSVRTTVGTRPALQTVLGGSSPYGGEESDTLITIATTKGLISIVFVAPQQQVAAMQTNFARMTRSIRLTQ